jgi:ribonuclease HII
MLFQSAAPVLGEVEARCRSDGLWPICGTDEAGRGPLAGPVVAAAVVLPDGAAEMLLGLDDSKRLDEAARDRLAPLIRTVALGFAVAEASPGLIDHVNILQASLDAMRRAVIDVQRQLGDRNLEAPLLLVVDGNQVVPGLAIAQRTVVQGDARSLCIAAASVLAKVHRDALMVAADTQFPGYGFAGHKGYPTPAHLRALQRLGPCPLHRASFAPVAAAHAARQGALGL